LLDGINGRNIHKGVETGDPVGNEEW